MPVSQVRLDPPNAGSFARRVRCLRAFANRADRQDKSPRRESSPCRDRPRVPRYKRGASYRLSSSRCGCRRRSDFATRRWKQACFRGLCRTFAARRHWRIVIVAVIEQPRFFHQPREILVPIFARVLTLDALHPVLPIPHRIRRWTVHKYPSTSRPLPGPA